jgi:hypothetical protein
VTFRHLYEQLSFCTNTEIYKPSILQTYPLSKIEMACWQKLQLLCKFIFALND